MNWKNQSNRSPLILRGARQVGKSYLVENFGKNHFRNTVTVNFELRPELKTCFDSFDVLEILNKLELMLGTTLTESDTLLFLDEIQECPKAISALRYFKENKPKQAIIAAGSLLEFALNAPDFKMPVGRVQFLYLKPLSFAEFLDAVDNSPLRQYLSNVTLATPHDEALHKKLLDLVKLYSFLGGMPAVIQSYCDQKNLTHCQTIQSALLQAFRSDFNKYSRATQYPHLEKVFKSIPTLIGKHLKYSHIDPDSKSKDLKQALYLLVLAGILYPVYSSSGSEVPLEAQSNELKFKVLYLDIGLMQNACGIQNHSFFEKNLLQINSGNLAEQLVGQELLGHQVAYEPAKLFFWQREKKGSQAEVDYLLQDSGEIYPLEVKAGKAGRLKSLRLFLDEKKSKLGVRVSQEKLSYVDHILSIPLYMVEQIPRLIKEPHIANSAG